MKKLVSFFAFLFLFGFSFGQQITVYQGELINPRKIGYGRILHQSDGGFVVQNEIPRGFRSSDLAISVFDTRLQLRSSNILNYPDKDLLYHDIVTIKKQKFLFLTRYDRNTKSKTLYGTKVDDNGMLGNIFELIVEEDQSRRVGSSFIINLNEDSTKILITTLPKYESREKQRIRFYTIDSEFKKYDDIVVEYPYLDRDININSVVMDKQENIHILGFLVNRDEKKPFGRRERTASIYSLYKGTDELKEYKINLDNNEDNYLNNLRLTTDKLGKIHCAGFYSDSRGSRFMKGIFVFTIDPVSKDVKNIKTQQFTDEFINQFLSEKQIKRKENAKDKGKSKFEELNNFNIVKLELKEGGGFYFIAEYQYVYVTTTTTAQGHVTSTTHYNYGDIIIADILPDNKVNWFARIPKVQNTTNDGAIYSGIAVALSGDNKLNIIFNDNKNNANVINPEKRRNMSLRSSVTCLVQIDKNGANPIKIPLMNTKEAKVIARPSRYYNVTNNELIMTATKGKNYQFMRIVLEE